MVSVDGTIVDDGTFGFDGDDHDEQPPPAPLPPGRLVIIDIKDSNGGTSPVAGRQYVIEAPDSSNPDWWKPGTAGMAITQRVPGASSRIWNATAGSVTIESVAGDSVTISFSGTMMQGAQFTDSPGTFSLKGSCTVDKVKHIDHALRSGS